MVPQERQVLQHILQIDEIRLLLVQEQEMELDYLLESDPRWDRRNPRKVCEEIGDLFHDFLIKN